MNKQPLGLQNNTINTGSSPMINKLQACDHGLEAVRQGKTTINKHLDKQ